jgi:hypothetical protein
MKAIDIVGRAAYFALGVAVTTAVFTQDAHAGLFDSALTSDWTTKPTNKFKLDMYGFDARAYEFETDNGMRCVAVFPGGTAKGWQLQCLPKAQ